MSLRTYFFRLNYCKVAAIISFMLGVRWWRDLRDTNTS